MVAMDTIVGDKYIRPSQLGRMISKIESTEMEVDLSGTTTSTTPVSTVTPSRESSQQTKTMKEKKKKKRRKKRKEPNGKMKVEEPLTRKGNLVWKNYIPPTKNPFVITEEEYNSNDVYIDTNREHDINDLALLIPSMDNLRRALTKNVDLGQDSVYTLEERAGDIWRLNRHFNITRGTIPRGNCLNNTSHCFGSSDSCTTVSSTFTHNERTSYSNNWTNPSQNNHINELTRHLEILHRGNIGNILPFTSNKYGEMDTFFQTSKSSHSGKS